MIDSVSILINGITLALAFGLLLIVLWHDARKPLHRYFAIFLFMVLFWNAGALLTQAGLLIGLDEPLLRVAVGAMELGFSGASVGAFALTTVLVRAQTRSFSGLLFLALLIVLGYRLLVSLSLPAVSADILNGGVAFNFQTQPLLLLFYLIFDGGTLYLIWRHRRKVRTPQIITGLSIFVIGQGISFLNPALQSFALSTVVSALASLLISFAVLKQDIINPLAERLSQVEAIHRVSLAITTQIALDEVLNQIAVQAAKWLSAEAVGIWLYNEGRLELSTVHNLPEQFLHRNLALGQGVSGTVALSRQSMHLEDYRRDWRGVPDLPVARETFGSVIAAPLTYRGDVIGALLVIAARDGRLFDKEDVYLLELLGAQAAVAIANSHLFAEQRALAQQVEASRSQLEKDVVKLRELDRMKNEMVRMTSHDLKNPLQAAMINLDLLRDTLEGREEAEAAQSINVIDRQLERMNRIIRGILDLERARTGTLKLETIAAARLVEEAADELRHITAERRIDFVVAVADDAPDIYCDVEQMKRVLVNLLENAFKFTPDQGRVRLTAAREGERLRFMVQDSGVGIPENAQANIFERFFRVNQAGTEHVSGSGLGLSLVKTVVEQHGGQVWFISREKVGTTFFVELPLMPRSEETL
jgi:signal transduction histidine kinase